MSITLLTLVTFAAYYATEWWVTAVIPFLREYHNEQWAGRAELTPIAWFERKPFSCDFCMSFWFSLVFSVLYNFKQSLSVFGLYTTVITTFAAAGFTYFLRKLLKVLKESIE